MRNSFIKSFVLTSAFMGLVAVADTSIQHLTINYSNVLFPVDRQGFAIPQAIVGGKVDFTGDAPVYLTMNIGGQSFTQPSDQYGNYSFFVYTNGAGQYDLRAWVPGSSTSKSENGIKIQKSL